LTPPPRDDLPRCPGANLARWLADEGSRVLAKLALERHRRPGVAPAGRDGSGEQGTLEVLDRVAGEFHDHLVEVL
jgi:hypothetical protein